MMIRFVRTAQLFAVIAALLIYSACGGDSSGPKTTVAGSWSGTGTTSTSSFTLSLILAENSGAVTGTGTLSGGSSIALTVTGTYSAPSVGLTFSSPGFENLNFSGTVSGKTMTGTLNGSGFAGNAITLTKP
jgi:hypothetical protein